MVGECAPVGELLLTAVAAVDHLLAQQSPPHQAGDGGADRPGNGGRGEAAAGGTPRVGLSHRVQGLEAVRDLEDGEAGAAGQQELCAQQPEHV